MLEWYLQLNITTTHPCQRRQENWSENHKRFIITIGNWWDLFKKPRLQLITYHTMQILSCQKVFLSVSLAAAAARCFALAWQQCSKLGNFSIGSRITAPSWPKMMEVLPWENHTKFLTQRPLIRYHGHKIICFCLIATLKTPESKKVRKSMKRVHCFGFPTHLVGKINIFQLSYQFSLSRSVFVVICSSCCQCDDWLLRGIVFKKNLEGSQRHSRLRKKYLSCPRFVQDTVRLSIPHLEFVAFV